MSPFANIGFAALAVLGAGWLVISFSAPSRRRSTVEWIATSALYTALIALFAHQWQRAWVEDSRVALFAFGFLLVFFAAGFVVSLVHTLLSLRRSGASSSDVVH